jgi:hypothetical protein
MNKEFIPYKYALELKHLGFDERCLTSYANDGDLMSVWNIGDSFEPATIMKDEPDSSYVINSVDFKNSEWCAAPLYSQAFRFFREKYDFTYSIGKTNIAVVHYGPTTQVLQDNDSYVSAEIAAIEWFVDVAKQIDNGKDK